MELFGLVGSIDSKIGDELFGGILSGQPEEPGGEVDHIPGGSAAEAVEPLVQLQAGGVIFVEWTSCHSVVVDWQAVVLGCLSGGYAIFDGFVEIHFESSCKKFDGLFLPVYIIVRRTLKCGLFFAGSA